MAAAEILVLTFLRRVLSAGPARPAPPEVSRRTAEQVDRQALLSMVAFDREILAAVVEAFVEHRGAQLQALEHAVEEQDARAIHAAAHTLCGGLRSLCVRDAAALAAGIEAAAGEGTVQGHGDALVELRWRLAAAEAELRELVSETATAPVQHAWAP